MVEPSRPPTTDSWSTMSRTVAVDRSAAHDPADKPAVVDDGHVGTDPGGRPCVDGDGPGEGLRRTHRNDPGRDERIAGRSGTGEQAVELGRPVAVDFAGGQEPRRRAFSASRRATSSRRPSTVPMYCGNATTGRTAAAVPRSTGPRTRPTAERSGSTGESSPPRTSRVITVKQASRSSTSTVRSRGCGEPGAAGRIRGSAHRRRGSETSTCWRASNSSTHLPAPIATECERVLGDVHRHAGLVPDAARPGRGAARRRR